MPGNAALTVSQLNNYVQRSLQRDPLLRDVAVIGEISNMHSHSSGLLFFSLKDENAMISCVLFPENLDAISVMPRDGMRVFVRGGVSLYERNGQYRLVVRQLHPNGEGVLYERLRRLHEKLAKEGVFSGAKRQLPLRIDTLGVVTSPSGAALQDVLTVSLRRDARLSVLLAPTRVQGATAVEEIVRAINTLDQIDRVSVIIVARGGGSIEDLWAFNEEPVVRAIASCKKPIITAVGHETDTTLSDLAADLRAPTPSAAAEMAVVSRVDTEQKLAAMRRQFYATIQASINEHSSCLRLAAARYEACHPHVRLEGLRQRVQGCRTELNTMIRRIVSQEKNKTCSLLEAFSLMNPWSVLDRGYAIIERNAEHLTSAKDLRTGDMVRLRFADGIALATILESGGKMDGFKEAKTDDI